MRNILISNDDGVLGPGILATKQALEDIANTALYLASDLSAYVSGQVIQVDGGMNM